MGALVGREESCLSVTECGFEVQSWRPRGVSHSTLLWGWKQPQARCKLGILAENSSLNTTQAQQPLLVAKERQGGICIPEPLHI